MQVVTICRFIFCDVYVRIYNYFFCNLLYRWLGLISFMHHFIHALAMCFR